MGTEFGAKVTFHLVVYIVFCSVGCNIFMLSDKTVPSVIGYFTSVLCSWFAFFTYLCRRIFVIKYKALCVNYTRTRFLRFECITSDVI
jgi:hypothetical protein